MRQTVAERDAAIIPAGQQPSYSEDYAAWLRFQLELMKAGRWAELDHGNLIDEVQSLERWSFDEFVAAVKTVVRHMLTWDMREDERSRDWASLIDLERQQVLAELADSLSYNDRRDEALSEAYQLARFEMSQEDKVPFRLFPDACPYSWEDTLARDHPLTREPDPKFTLYRI
jgi:hypothetical protein